MFTVLCTLKSQLFLYYGQGYIMHKQYNDYKNVGNFS